MRQPIAQLMDVAGQVGVVFQNYILLRHRTVLGNLVTAGATLGATGSTASARPLFSISGTDTVRVYVDVPQSAMGFVQPGAKVDVLVRGPGSGRESAIRALAAAGIEVRSIRDVTPVPHNGCRPPKRRRV